MVVLVLVLVLVRPPCPQRLPSLRHRHQPYFTAAGTLHGRRRLCTCHSIALPLAYAGRWGAQFGAELLAAGCCHARLGLRGDELGLASLASFRCQT